MRFLTLALTLLRRLAWPLLTICTLLPTLATAQGHTLHVSVHDLDGRGVAGIAVVVRSETGQELVRQTTAAEGTVTFIDLPTIIRVAVEGQARRGPQLYQLGDDTNGVRFDLGPVGVEARLDLRVERDGLVLPDPATMLALEDGGPAVDQLTALPTAAAATPVLVVLTPADTGAGVVHVGEAPASAEDRGAGWVPLVTLFLVVAALVVLRLAQKLRGGR